MDKRIDKMSSITSALVKKQLITPPKFIRESVQFEVQTGSVAYGCSGETSDIDVMGWCIPPKHTLFPHLAGKIQGFDKDMSRFDQYQKHHIKDISTDKEYDLSIYNIVKYFRLVADNNPNMIDSLFVPRRCVLFSTEVGELVRENRHIFLHKGAWHKFKGYAFSQLHKCSKQVRENPERQESIDKYGYDVKYAYHIVRLLDEVEQILTEHDLDLERNREQLKSIRRGEWSLEKIQEYFTVKEKDLESAYSASTLPHRPGEDKIKQLLYDVLEAHYGSLEQAIVKNETVVIRECLENIIASAEKIKKCKRQLLKICRFVKEYGGTAYVVGGYVRDLYLELDDTHKDIDIEVFGIAFDKLRIILKQLGTIKECGKHFGVLKLGEFDISLPRTEVKTGEKHNDFIVVTDSRLTTLKACSRRDFTMNTLMYDPLENILIDHFDAINTDMKQKVIRHTKDTTFVEDPLRILRAAQFASRFKMTVADETTKLCKSFVHTLKHLPKERITVEIEKILFGEEPSRGFRWLEEIGALEVIFPELNVLRSIKQGTRYHREGDVFEHTMLALDSVKKEDKTLTRMLAVLLHDTGKAVIGGTPVGDDHVSFKGHAQYTRKAESFLDRLTVPSNVKQEVITLLKAHMRPYDLMDSIYKKALRKLAVILDIEDLMVVHRADKMGRKIINDLTYIDEILLKAKEVEDEIKPIVLGRHLIDLGMSPSTEFGKILKVLFEAQLEGLFSTLEEGLQYLESNGISKL